jgi:Protein of unknown function (DUF2934)
MEIFGMNADREQRIAARAYQLWEEEGRPHGAHERHWEQASREIVASEGKQPGRRARTAKPGAKAALSSPSAAKAKSPAKPKVAAEATEPRVRTGRAKQGSTEKATRH